MKIKQPIIIFISTLGLIFLSFSIGHSTVPEDYFIEGSGVRTTQERSVPEFKGILFDGIYEVTIQCGKKQIVQLTGDDNIMPFITTEVFDGVLHVVMTKSVNAKHKISVAIDMERIEAINVSGSSTILVHDVDSRNLVFDIDGTGIYFVDGRAGSFQARISGAGNIQARGFTTAKTNIHIKGTGDVAISVTEELDVFIDGIGNIDYWGNPQTVTKNISGIGNVTKQ
jgi:hypothetical protein